MSQIGSFALLLALGAERIFVSCGRACALSRPGPRSERLGETARRAGIATFAVVFLAALVLVISAFQKRFLRRLHFSPQQSRPPGAYKFATLWSGQEGSLLFWALLLSAYGLVCGCVTRPISGFRPRLGRSLPRCRFSFCCW